MEIYEGKVPSVLHAMYLNAVDPKHPRQHLWMKAFLLLTKPQIVTNGTFDDFDDEAAARPKRR